MDDPAPHCRMIAQDGKRVGDRIAAVHQNRLIDSLCQLNLTDKRRLLFGVVVLIPIVVQADFTNGRDILIIDQSF